MLKNKSGCFFLNTVYNAPIIIIFFIYFIIIIIIKNECHSNIIVDKLQGCGHSKKKLQGKCKSVTQQ